MTYTCVIYSWRRRLLSSAALSAQARGAGGLVARGSWRRLVAHVSPEQEDMYNVQGLRCARSSAERLKGERDGVVSSKKVRCAGPMGQHDARGTRCGARVKMSSLINLKIAIRISDYFKFKSSGSLFHIPKLFGASC